MRDFEARVVDAKRRIRARSIDGIERRTVPFSWVQTRAADDAEGAFEIVGHAAVFNDLSEDLGYFDSWYERIAPGAFRSVLDKKPDVRALFNHDPNLVLARTKSDSLHLAEDDTGLQYRAEVPAGLSYGNDLRILLERGDVDQSSFAFRVGEATWDEEEDPDGGDDPIMIRTITKFSDLFDVSPVTYPAYPTADSGLASPPTTFYTHPFATGGIVTTTFTTPSPDAERNGDGPARERTDDGGTEEAGGATEGLTAERVKQRLRLRGARLRA